MNRIRCCTHNPCPTRPRHWLGRFASRPWRCEQCGQWWKTQHVTGYADWDTGGHYEWIRLEPTP